MKVGCERKKGGGRKTKDPEMEKLLFRWYSHKKANDEPVTAKMIKEKAIELTTCQDFIASKGWLDKFKIRYRLDIAKEQALQFGRIASSSSTMRLLKTEDDGADHSITRVSSLAADYSRNYKDESSEEEDSLLMDDSSEMELE